MRRSSAQRLLFQQDMRPGFGLRGLMTMLCLCTGCLAPPDGRLPPDLANFPPEIDQDSVRPRQSRLEVGPRCNPFVQLSARDEDNDTLLSRCIIDNRTSLGTVVLASERRFPDSFAGVTVDCRVFNTDLPGGRPSLPEEKFPDSLALVVTDAPVFAVSSTLAGDFDFAAIDPDPNNDGVVEYSVSIVTWTIDNVTDEAACP